MLVIVIIIDGLSKKEAPGSLWDPAPTSLNAASANKLGIAFGLFMAGVRRLSLVCFESLTTLYHVVCWSCCYSFLGERYDQSFRIRQND
jgi:hypothetical protein